VIPGAWSRGEDLEDALVRATDPGELRAPVASELLRGLARAPRGLGEPQDIANAALFLCSPAASWISGQVLTISGSGIQELDT